MHEVKAFKCDHCSMVSVHKHSVKRHELQYCRKSPDRHTCMACLNFENNGLKDPYCVDDRQDIDSRFINDNNCCEFFESKFKV